MIVLKILVGDKVSISINFAHGQWCMLLNAPALCTLLYFFKLKRFVCLCLAVSSLCLGSSLI